MTYWKIMREDLPKGGFKIVSDIFVYMHYYVEFFSRVHKRGTEKVREDILKAWERNDSVDFRWIFKRKENYRK